jgi:hypothetical protein
MIRLALKPILLIVSLLMFPVFGFALELRELLDAPGKFDGQLVKITGTAGEPRFQESRGKPFTVFDLSDRGDKTVRIFFWGRLDIRRGQKVSVEGRFIKSKQVGLHTLQNEIEASTVRPLPERY